MEACTFSSLRANAPRVVDLLHLAFWSSTSSLWSSTTSAASWASSSASSLLSFASAPAQGDGPDHYRPDSPDDFRVACRDVSMPLPEERCP